MSSDPPHNPPEWDREYELETENAKLRKVLRKALARLNDGSAWADDSDEYREMCEAVGYEP